MPNDVIAELEIDSNPILHFTDIFLRQRFNNHHEFSIRINHDVVEASDSFSLDNSKNLIGKSVVIRLLENPVSRQVTYEFNGIVCEIGMVQSHNSVGDLLIKGYSPTILLEDGPHLASYGEKNLSYIVEHAIQAGWSKTSRPQHINPNYTSPIKYISQYKESTFHFLNRLSSDYGELFYYDGSTIIFGSPSVMEFVEVTYGEDMSDMQLNLHIEPIEAWKYAYGSRQHHFMTSRGTDLSGLDNYPRHVVQVSNELYSDLDDIPLMQRVESMSELENFVNKSKEAKAAGLVVLTGTTNNPNIAIGSVAAIQISRRDGADFRREDYGSYLVTGITHHITANGRYSNTFEALSGWVKGIPVYNALMPSAEPQFGWVVDNHDPDHLSRVQVQLLWQKDDEKTDWIWVMTPDAGSGKDGTPGSGMVFIPEVGDRVLVGFLYNNPDRPFIMGSIFHGKSARSADPKCLKGRSGAKVCIDEAAGSVTIEDKNHNKIFLDGTGNISITCSNSITLNAGGTGGSTIVLNSNGLTSIDGSNIVITGSEDVYAASSDSFVDLTPDAITLGGNEGSFGGYDKLELFSSRGNAEVSAQTNMEVKANGNTTISATSTTNINGGTVNINS